MTREVQAPVEERFVERWSPRSFDQNHEISNRKLRIIFEAARWSPSCYNIQPWRFIYTKKQDDENFERFVGLLNDMNKVWAQNASALGFIISKNTNDEGAENFYSQFDTGAAWMAMTMQARDLGLYTHAVGGIKKDDIYKSFNIDKSAYTIICGFAIGKRDNPEELPDKLQKMESKNDRIDLEKIMFENIWQG